MSFRVRLIIYLVVLCALAAVPGAHWWELPVGAVTYLLLFWRWIKGLR